MQKISKKNEVLANLVLQNTFPSNFSPLWLGHCESSFNPGHCFCMLLQMAINETAQDLISFKNSMF